MHKLDLPIFLKERRLPEIGDDFWSFNSAYQWWTTAATAVGGESVAVSATLLGGQVVLTTGGTQANQAGFYSTVKGFKAAANTPMEFEMALQYVDANSHDAGIFMGFSDVLNGTVGSSPLITNGTLTKASMTAFGFAKLSTGTNWTVLSQVTTTVMTNTTTIAADDASGSAVHIFRFSVEFISTTQCDVTFFIDGVQCIDNSSKLPIKHTISFGSTAMYTGATCVAGSAHSQTPQIDYIYAGQLQRYNIN